MKWYDLLLGCENDEPPYYISSRGDLDGFKRWHFDKGTPIEDWKSRGWIQSTSADKDGPPDDGLANHFGLLIFSSKMQVALENEGVAGIQYLPIRVLKSDNSEYLGYSIANILNFPSGLDWKRSDFSVFTDEDGEGDKIGQISSLRKAVLDEHAVGKFHIIRLREFPPAVYVSQVFAEIFTKHKLSGYSFTEVAVSRPADSQTVSAIE
jgi:hypothetical protein